MSAVPIMVIGTLALCGCARQPHEESAPAAKRAAGTAATTDTQRPSPANSASADRPSYEVAIASAQADRVHALNSCDDKQGAPRAACVRAADSAYDQSRGAAEEIRGNER